MKIVKITIVLIIVLFTLHKTNYVYASEPINQEFTFYLKDQGNFFLNQSITNNMFLNQKIYPGSSGYFDIILNSKEYSFDINYNLKFLNLKNRPHNLHFYINGEIVDQIEEYNSIQGFLEKGKEEKIQRIYWIWNYEKEETCNYQGEFTFDMNLIVERHIVNHIGNKLPRTGMFGETIIGLALSILIIFLTYILKNKIRKENNEIIKNNK